MIITASGIYNQAIFPNCLVIKNKAIGGDWTIYNLSYYQHYMATIS